jgi:hypothetical protein
MGTRIQTGFTRYEGGYEMISLRAGMLMGKNFYPLDRRVRVRVGTTRTRLSMSKMYPHQFHYNHLIEPVLVKIKPFSSIICLDTKLCDHMICYM